MFSIADRKEPVGIEPSGNKQQKIDMKMKIVG